MKRAMRIVQEDFWLLRAGGKKFQTQITFPEAPIGKPTTTLLSQTINADGSNPFKKPQYLLLNLALGGNGGDPKESNFPIKYEVDYVRVYQDKNK